ncbi:MAG TPA: MazG-like family protein [Thermodesulfobacteriota bacterium]|jgi:NTP pyrophosphatase (non-canonical NTP hydrolase)|nr:MazG-like family protein [Thermodesulfobacteriota bacterium]
MYYIYHIPGKKIGVTCNLNKRVTITQGYSPDEYEVLDQSDDINYISEKEIELQKSYGYKIDRKLYKNLFNKMKINVTEQTTTFPYPVTKLKGNLMDNIGFEWKSEHGDFVLNLDSIRWIMKNVKTSMYNNNRSYVYNKAFAEWFKTPELWSEDQVDQKPLTINSDRFELIRDWARSRGLYDKGNSHTQYVKLQEEAGELAKALLKDDKPEVIDAIGDMVVVLTNLAHLQGVTIEDCVDSAYTVISKRTGKMINGTFVKDE